MEAPPNGLSPDWGVLLERIRGISETTARIEEHVKLTNGEVARHAIWIAQNTEKMTALERRGELMAGQLAQHQTWIDRCEIEPLKKEVSELREITDSHKQYFAELRGGWQTIAKVASIIAGICGLFLTIIQLISKLHI
jgi:hypothetical protein